MPNTTLKQAIKEAYASAPTNTVIYDTIELKHPLLTPTIRFVKDHFDLTATLETGDEVVFTAYAFSLELPEIGQKESTSYITVSIDNTDRSIYEKLRSIVTSTVPMTLTYRPYISTDLSTPQYDPPLVLEMHEISTNISTITLKAKFRDFYNNFFSKSIYTYTEFPGAISD